MGTPESRLHRLRQRGQGNFELAANYDYIHEGQRTLAKVYVGVGLGIGCFLKNPTCITYFQI